MHSYGAGMKKISLFLLVICLLCLGACDNKETKKSVKDVGQTSTNQTESIQETQTETPEAVENSEQEDAKVRILNLDKTLFVQYEWPGEDVHMLVLSQYSNVTFQKEEEKNYPLLATAVGEYATMVKNTMLDEFDNLVSSAYEKYNNTTDYFKNNGTKVSTSDMQVRRSDSVAVSLLSDCYSDNGNNKKIRTINTSNYDTETGQKLKIRDVVEDMSALPKLAEDAIVNEMMFGGEFLSETAVSDYFKGTEESIKWTLDYNGVTFYFNPGDIASTEYGIQTATIPFAEHPELFYDKYKKVPEAYMVSLSPGNPFFTDLDGDGHCEKILVSGEYNEEDRYYSQLYIGVYTYLKDYNEKIFTCNFHPYYVKTADGKHYLYVFCEGSEAMNRQISLSVYSLNNGKIQAIGDKDVAPHYKQIESDPEHYVFAVPANPEECYLDNFEDASSEEDLYNLQEGAAYKVGKDGVPEQK